MHPTHFLWQAAGRPALPGLLNSADYAALKRKPASYAPTGPCYLCGHELTQAALPTSKRFDDKTWTAHATAACVDSEWLCPACAFSMSEYVERPDLWPKRFKIRCQTHYVVGDTWTVLGLSDKLQMREPLLTPPADPWLLAICDSPLSAGHNLYLTQVNQPGALDWRVMLGRISVAGSAPALAHLLYHVEQLYSAGHSKSAIASGDYLPKWINAQGLDAWADHESNLAPLRQTPLFELALFLAQKGNDE